MNIKELSPYGTREYTFTVAFELAEDYIKKSFLEEQLKGIQRIKQHSKDFPAPDFVSKESLNACDQGIASIKALLAGKERAVYHDSETCLIDIISKDNGILYRIFLAPNVHFKKTCLEEEIRVFERRFSGLGNYKTYIENDEDLSE